MPRNSKAVLIPVTPFNRHGGNHISFNLKKERKVAADQRYYVQGNGGMHVPNHGDGVLNFCMKVIDHDLVGRHRNLTKKFFQSTSCVEIVTGIPNLLLS